jgi:hypothetical protein
VDAEAWNIDDPWKNLHRLTVIILTRHSFFHWGNGDKTNPKYQASFRVDNSEEQRVNSTHAMPHTIYEMTL